MEIALDRVCAPYLQKKALKKKPSEQGGGPSSSATISRYADQISPDEIRFKVMKCVEILMQTDYGMNFVLLSTGLIRQIIWCFSRPSEETSQDPRARGIYLKLLSLIARIMGPACFLDSGLKDTVVSVIGELKRHQNEPYPFYHLVESLRNPGGAIQKRMSSLPLSARQAMEALDSTPDLDLDVWNYRTQIMVFFNGIVSSGKTISKRGKMRKTLESCGLRVILKSLVAMDPTPEFTAQVNLYNQDRKLDAEEIEKEYKRRNDDDKKYVIIDVLDG